MDSDIRKALEDRLRDSQPQLVAAVTEVSPGMPNDPAWPLPKTEVPLWFPNMTFTAESAPVYIRMTFHPAAKRARTIGPTPRVERAGFSIAGIHCRLGHGPDIADNLAKAIEAAYPYAGELQRGDVRVHLELVEPRPAFPAGNRWYLPVHINWTVWRAT